MTQPNYGPDFWDQRYADAAQDYVFGTAPNDFLAEVADRIPAGGPVLCLGEGEGRNAVFLARRGHAVTAVDQSAAGLTKAGHLAAAQGVSITTAVADLGDYAIDPGTWAAIVSIFCHLPLEMRRRVHAQAAAGLRPDGVVILEAYTPKQVAHGTGGPVNNPSRLMSLGDVRDEFPGLTWEIAHEVEREVIEGHAHSGRAAVVQLLGRR